MADVSFVNTDPTYYQELLINAYQNITNRTLYPADPDRLLVDLQTYATALLAIAINETGKQNLLAYASRFCFPVSFIAIATRAVAYVCKSTSSRSGSAGYSVLFVMF